MVKCISIDQWYFSKTKYLDVRIKMYKKMSKPHFSVKGMDIHYYRAFSIVAGVQYDGNISYAFLIEHVFANSNSFSYGM